MLGSWSRPPELQPQPKAAARVAVINSSSGMHGSAVAARDIYPNQSYKLKLQRKDINSLGTIESLLIAYSLSLSEHCYPHS